MRLTVVVTVLLSLWGQRGFAQRNSTQCASNITCGGLVGAQCPAGRTCRYPTSSTLGCCSDKLPTVCGNLTAVNEVLDGRKCQTNIKGDDKTNSTVLCSSFWGAMQCLMKELITDDKKMEDCKYDLKHLIKRHHSMLAAKVIGESYNRRWNASQCTEFWDESCPAYSQGTFGLCSGKEMCTADGKCNNSQSCCSTVCGEKCLPDLKKCIDIMQLVTKTVETPKCLSSFVVLTEETLTLDVYCSNFWGGLTCLADIIGMEYKDHCLERMAKLVMLDPKRILSSIKLMIGTIPFNEKWMDQSATCKQNPLKPKDDVEPCLNQSRLKGSLIGCKKLTSFSNQYSTAECSAFKEMVMCMAKNITRNKENEQRKCVYQIQALYERGGPIVSALMPLMKNFKPSKCIEKENVCGNKDMPLDEVSCPRQSCPRPYVCKRGYCCPQQKEGSCPSRFSKNICGLRCMADSDCIGDDNKCCDIGCGHKTCAKSVKMEMSQCEKEYKRSKQRLEMTGPCGDGVSDMSVTKCQGKKHFPSQIKNEMTGEMYCVDEQGNKIPGSDHQGNVDCTKVKPGRCSSEPSQCETTIDNCKKNDDEKCGDGKKCCLTRKPNSNICIRQCTTAQEVGENDIIADTCTKGRSCCNIAMCESKKCLADVSAICRINSCGGCSVDFYNASNEIVDCDEGVTLCVKQREEARQANIGNIRNRIKEIIEGRSPSQSENYNSREDDEERKEYDERNEYADRKEEESDNDQEKDMSEMDMDGVSGCALIVKYDLCKNGATCAFNKEENEDCFKLCDCKPGYRGLFCESKEPETRNSITDSECGRRNERIGTLMQILKKSSAMSEILRVLIKSHKSKCNILPQSFACDANGNFKSVQIGLIIGNLYKYCVEPETGNRKPYTDVVLESAGTKPDCSKEREVEIMKLPGKCLHQKVAEQSASKEESSRFYYNNADRQCVSGSASGRMSGFYSANDCYQTCGYFTDYKCPAVPDGTVGTCVEACQDCDKSQLCCSHGCGHVCKSAVKSEITPLPCEKDTSCNYKKQYCDAESGKCAAYPQHCTEDPRPGDGNIRIKAFYFNVTLRMCMPFVYMGNSGSENRFDTIHQCQTECASRAYKNKGAVCPNPRALASHPPKDMQEENCHSDYSCDGNEVCCSTTFSTVCSAPIESPCLNGNRCAPYGFCENNKCMCELTRCTNDSSSKVCGSDGKTYNNTCLLKYTACRTWRLISVVSRGECDEKLPDEPRKCPIACTKDYRPVCAYDKTDKPKLVEYSNPCVMKDAVQCNKADSHLLYNGLCKRECGNNTCEIYENCVDNKCGCPSFCTEDYRPVCGHPIGFSAEALHFDNECHLRKYGCEKKEIFVISSMDKCANPEPMLECPPTRHDIPKSADHGCGLNNNDKYCNKTTERCCRVGAGTRCISKRLLIRKVTVKDGSCPMSVPLKDIYEKCDANIKCSADDDCRANAKCCPKHGCPHGVCTMPVGLPSLGECGTDQKPVNGLLCDPSAKEQFCTDGATCTTVDRDGQQYGVCCKSKNSLPADKEAIMKAKVCQTLYAMGVKCLNGGKCIGDLKNRQICKCTTPYKGAFCNKTTETSTCETQQQIWRVLYRKMNTMCEKKMDDNDSAEKETERAEKDTREERRKRDEDDMPQKEHRDDDDTWQKEHREDSEREMECSFSKGDILVSHLIKLLKMMGLSMIYNKGEVACANTLFKQAQCFKRLQGNDVYCQCVDKNTGMPVPNSPKGRTAAEIDCSITEFPKVCLKMPDLTKCSNGGATTRWYFNASLGFCQNTTCSIGDEGNNFEDYNTCNSVCFSNAVYSGEGCSRVRCRANTECRTMNGETKCHDISGGPKGGMGQFEPRCTAAGTFEVKQCHGDACRCVDPTTGVPIPGSTAHARVLQCVDNNGKIDVQIDDSSAYVCKDGADITFCERGGNICDNCTMTKPGEDGRGGNPPKEKDHGVCDTCKTCPGGGKLKLCEKTCSKNDMCPGFVEAICRVNRCTCALEFVDSNNAVVNCSKVKAQCERQKHNLKIEERARQYNTSGKPSESQTQIKCTPSGTYEAICLGGSCYCLNASNGEKVSKTKTDRNIDAIDCSKTQNETNPVLATAMFKVSERELDNLSDKEKKAFLVGVNKFVSKHVSVKKQKLRKGSVFYEFDCEKLSPSSDLMSDLNAMIIEINTGQAAIIVDGESVVLSEAEVADFITSSDLVQPTTTETTPPEDNDVVIIVVVVVVVIVLLLAVLIGCYFFRKSQTSKENGTEFSNIHGQSNPTYKHA